MQNNPIIKLIQLPDDKGKQIYNIVLTDLCGNNYLVTEFKIDTRTNAITPHRPEGQNFEVYIEKINLDYTLFFYENGKETSNISSNNIDYISLHSSSQVNIHCNGNRIPLFQGHTHTRNIKNQNLKDPQPIFGFGVNYKSICDFIKINSTDLFTSKNLWKEHDSFVISFQFITGMDYEKTLYDFADVIPSPFNDGNNLIIGYTFSSILKSNNTSKTPTDPAQFELFLQNTKQNDPQELSKILDVEMISFINLFNLPNEYIEGAKKFYKTWGVFGYDPITFNSVSKKAIFLFK